jgi:hypothetical protein
MEESTSFVPLAVGAAAAGAPARSQPRTNWKGKFQEAEASLKRQRTEEAAWKRVLEEDARELLGDGLPLVSRKALREALSQEEARRAKEEERNATLQEANRKLQGELRSALGAQHQHQKAAEEARQEAADAQEKAAYARQEVEDCSVLARLADKSREAAEEVTRLTEKMLEAAVKGKRKAESALARERDTARDSELCVVCMTAKRNAIFMPCMHAVCCEPCARHCAATSSKSCPVCKGPVTEARRIYT